MKLQDVVNSEALRTYFGTKADRWIPELTALLAKKGIEQGDINDKSVEAQLNQTTRWSWLGFLFTWLWAAYHNVGYWIPVTLTFAALGYLDTVFFDDRFVIPLSIAPAVVYGLYGKSFLLAAKAKELSATGSLQGVAWSRVVVSLVISVAAAVIATAKTLEDEPQFSALLSGSSVAAYDCEALIPEIIALSEEDRVYNGYAILKINSASQLSFTTDRLECAGEALWTDKDRTKIIFAVYEDYDGELLIEYEVP